MTHSGWLPGPARAALAPVVGAGLALGFLLPEARSVTWIALAALFALVVTAAPGRAATEGFAAGFVFYSLILRWFAAAILDYSTLSPWLALAAVLASGVVLAAGTAIVAASAARVAGRFGAGAGLAAAALLWFVHELVRGVFPLPFPWAVLSAVVSGGEGLALGVARSAGSAGLSLLLALGAATLAAVMLEPGRAWPAPVAWCALAGGLAVAVAPPAGGEPLVVAAAQGSLPRTAHPHDRLETYRQLTEQAAREGARLVVWPESAVPYRVDEHPVYLRVMEDLARREQVDLIVGTLTTAPEGDGLMNSAALIRAGAGLTTVSSKRQLVPFGEYLPMRFLFGNVPALAAEAGDFLPGRSITLHPVRGGRAGCLICYEAVFPSLASDMVREGADLLINITNDSWFGWTSGPGQHLAHSRLRAAETGRPLVRAANSGISTIIAADGRELGRLELGQRGVVIATVRVAAAPAPGHEVARVLAVLCATLAVVVLVAAWLPWPLRRGASPSRRFPQMPTGHEAPTERNSDA